VIEKADLARTPASSLHFPAVVKAQVRPADAGRQAEVPAATSAQEFVL
jgi:hypothetical protein